MPPETATTDNPFDEWIGAQMRGIICGMVVPGRAREAARLAWVDAEVSHAGNGILGEVFNAVLAARAFVEPDVRSLLTSTIALFNTDTEYGAVLDFALKACEAASDWRDAWAVCDARYVEYNWIHAYPNAAAEVIALYFGKGDFDLTLEIVCGIGHDVDCNAAQILGVAIGRGAVVAMVHPEHGDVRLGLRGEMEDGGLVGTEIGGDDDRVAGERDGPGDDQKRRRRG